MLIYAVLYVFVAKGTVILGVPSLLMAFIVATVYAVLIAQFRRRDIAILKCVSWGNWDILLLLIGEVILVSFTAFLIVFQLSVEILGLVYYFQGVDLFILSSLYDLIAIPADVMGVTILIIVVCQIPGLILAQWRAMRIPPMQALREE
jgi:ABC-type antimicrobial peptide transport system permease subunit